MPCCYMFVFNMSKAFTFTCKFFTRKRLTRKFFTCKMHKILHVKSLHVKVLHVKVIRIPGGSCQGLIFVHPETLVPVP